MKIQSLWYGGSDSAAGPQFLMPLLCLTCLKATDVDELLYRSAGVTQAKGQQMKSFLCQGIIE